MTQIFLVRHGQAEGNIYRRVQGQVNAPLTREGRAQLAYLAERFAEIPLDAAYSSDLDRAFDTACACAGGRVPVVKDRRLREMCFGAWEKQPWGDVNRLYPELKTWFLCDPDRWYVPGAERYAEVQDRMVEVMTEIGRRHEGGTVLAGCHGMAIQAFLARVLGVRSENIREVPLPKNTAVALLHFEEGRFVPEYYNDISHLPVPPFTPQRKTLAVPGAKDWDLHYTPFDTENGRELFLRCYRDAWQTAHGTLRGFDERACWEGALYRAAQEPESLLAAWREDEFAGILALDSRRGRSRGLGWISFCYVMPELRRHHCGIQLIGTAVTWYRDRGRRALRLTVAPENPAVGFYEKAGFVPVDREDGALGRLLVMEMAI